MKKLELLKRISESKKIILRGGRKRFYFCNVISKKLYTRFCQFKTLTKHERLFMIDNTIVCEYRVKLANRYVSRYFIVREEAVV